MKCYLKHNFQYVIATIFWIVFAFHHLINTGRVGIIIGSVIAGAFSISWSLFRYNELFGRRK